MFKKKEMIPCNVQIGSLVRSLQPNAQYFVDAMSSFGAVPLNLEHVDWVVSSANKCLQVEPYFYEEILLFEELTTFLQLFKGVPGFSYAICRSSVLASCKGNARSLSLDLEDQVFAKLPSFLLENAWHIFSGCQHEQDRTVPVHPTDPHPAGLQESFGGVPRRGRA